MSAVFYNPATGQVFTPRQVPPLRERSRSNDSHLPADVGQQILETLLGHIEPTTATTTRRSTPSRRRFDHFQDNEFNSLRLREDPQLLLTTFTQPKGREQRRRLPERPIARDLAGPTNYPDSFDPRHAIQKPVVGNEEASALFRSALRHALHQETLAEKERQEQTRAAQHHRKEVESHPNQRAPFSQRLHEREEMARRRLQDRANLARERGVLPFQFDGADADEREIEYDVRSEAEVEEASPALESFFRNNNRETSDPRTSKEDESRESDFTEEEYGQLLRRVGEVSRIRSFVELEEQRLASKLRQAEFLRYQQHRQEDLQARIKHANEERSILSKEAEELISAVEVRRARMRALDDIVREAEERLKELEAMSIKEATQSSQETSRGGRISPGEPLSKEETAIVREMTKAHTDRDFTRDEIVQTHKTSLEPIEAKPQRTIEILHEPRKLTEKAEAKPQQTIEIVHEPRKIPEKAEAKPKRTIDVLHEPRKIPEETIIVHPLWECQQDGRDAEEKRDPVAHQTKPCELHSLLQEETREARRNANSETEGVVRKFQMEQQQQPEEKGKRAYVGEAARQLRADSGTDILPRELKTIFIVPQAPAPSREGVDKASSTASSQGSAGSSPKVVPVTIKSSAESSPQIVPVTIRSSAGTRNVRETPLAEKVPSASQSRNAESAPNSAGSTSAQPSISESEWARKREAAAEKIGNFVRNRIETASDRQALQHLRSLADYARKLEQVTKTEKPAAFADPITFSVWDGPQDELPRLDQSGVLPPGVHVNPCHHDFLRYESSLNKLLQGVDQIESAGHDEIREIRKRLVERVQDYLEELDAQKRDAWNVFKNSVEQQQKPSERSEDDRTVASDTQTKSEPTPVEQSEADQKNGASEAPAISEPKTEEKSEEDQTVVSETQAQPEPAAEQKSEEDRPVAPETQAQPEPAAEEKPEEDRPVLLETQAQPQPTTEEKVEVDDVVAEAAAVPLPEKTGEGDTSLTEDEEQSLV